MSSMQAAAFLMAMAVSALLARGQCAVCGNQRVDVMNNDACTTSSTLWTRENPGDCKLNPKCLPNTPCYFSVTLGVVDRCGRLYGSQYCTAIVDGNGNVVGGFACGSTAAFPVPPGICMVTDYPILCGKRDEMRIMRLNPDGTVSTVATFGGICKACPGQE